MADNEKISFLVYQLFVNEEESKIEGNTIKSDIHIDTVIRHIKAKSKEEAIGKFVLATNDIKCKRKVDPIICFELKLLICID